jgi:O-antigen/teichoic acid export membrane protein
MRADIFVIGKLCSATDLGIYSMAAALGQIPFSLGGALIGQIANPAFSEMQNDSTRLNKTLLKVTSVVGLFIFSPILYVILYGKDTLLVVYGGAYAKAAAPFAILFSIAMLRTLSVPVMSLYYMIGRPELNRWFTVVRTVVMIALIYPATKWYGLTGAAGAGLIAMILGYVLQVFRLRTITDLDISQYNRTLWKALPISLSVAIVWIGTHHTLRFAPLAQITIGGLGCLLGYIVAVFLRPRVAGCQV